MSLADRIREIKDRVEKATEGPWFYREHTLDDDTAPTVETESSGIAMQVDRGTKADFLFLAKAREDIPFLLSELDKYQRALEVARKYFSCFCSQDGKCSSCFYRDRMDSILEGEG
jgi:hypothetical protein